MDCGVRIIIDGSSDVEADDGGVVIHAGDEDSDDGFGDLEESPQRPVRVGEKVQTESTDSESESESDIDSDVDSESDKSEQDSDEEEEEEEEDERGLGLVGMVFGVIPDDDEFDSDGSFGESDEDSESEDEVDEPVNGMLFLYAFQSHVVYPFFLGAVPRRSFCNALLGGGDSDSDDDVDKDDKSEESDGSGDSSSTLSVDPTDQSWRTEFETAFGVAGVTVSSGPRSPKLAPNTSSSSPQLTTSSTHIVQTSATTYASSSSSSTLNIYQTQISTVQTSPTVSLSLITSTSTLTSTTVTRACTPMPIGPPPIVIKTDFPSTNMERVSKAMERKAFVWGMNSSWGQVNGSRALNQAALAHLHQGSTSHGKQDFSSTTRIDPRYKIFWDGPKKIVQGVREDDFDFKVEIDLDAGW